ncbi:MAG: cation:proton antiporter [Desulfobacterales bacterium]|nr:cation:proton antiporter [Desulfobacterales bacterium]
MDLWVFLMEVVVLLGGAFVLGALAQRLRQSPILGYLLAGTIAGPMMFNAAAVNQAAELGVSLLLFSIGLEFSFGQLRRMGRLAFGGGSLQVTATLALVALAASAFLTLPQALTLGAIVALSSTAVVLRLLVDRAEIDSVHGRTSLAILLLQDIAVVPLVLMVSLFAPAAGDTSLGLHLIKIVMSVAALAAGFYLLLYRVVPVLLSQSTLFANRELTVLLAITVGLGAAWSAHAIGVSPALGAFVAGMLLGESPFATQVRADIGSLRIIMVTLFFASVGMLAKPLWFLTHLHWILPAAMLVFLLKGTVIAVVCRIFGLGSRQALATGITLGQVGEFSFVLAAAARTGGILEGDIIDLVVSVIIVLMFVTPYLIASALPVADRLVSLTSRSPGAAGQPLRAENAAPGDRVLVVGLGPAGRGVVELLLAHQRAPVVIDVNPKSRLYGEKIGIEIHLGDAGQEEILTHAGLQKISLAVVTVPDPDTCEQVVSMIRGLRPDLPIAARCRYNRHLEALRNAGADLIIDEETLMGKTLGEAVLARLETDSCTGLACRMAGRTPESTNQQ